MERTVRKLAQAFGGRGINETRALEDELLDLAGLRTRQSYISQPLAEMLDIVKGFSEPKLKVVSTFAAYLRDK